MLSVILRLQVCAACRCGHATSARPPSTEPEAAAALSRCRPDATSFSVSNARVQCNHPGGRANSPPCGCRLIARPAPVVLSDLAREPEGILGDIGHDPRSKS